MDQICLRPNVEGWLNNKSRARSNKSTLVTFNFFHCIAGNTNLLLFFLLSSAFFFCLFQYFVFWLNKNAVYRFHFSSLCSPIRPDEPTRSNPYVTGLDLFGLCGTKHAKPTQPSLCSLVRFLFPPNPTRPVNNPNWLTTFKKNKNVKNAK